MALGMAISSMYASMAAWFTPTMLFCVMNLIIGTIFIASKTNGDTKPHDQVNPKIFRPIARVSSFLDRARSVNLSSCTTTIATVAESLQLRRSSPTATYSSLSRLAQSIFLSSSHAASPEFSYGDKMSQSESERKPTRRPPSLLERVKSVKFSSGYNNTSQTESEEISDSPGQLVRFPSFLNRVKSFKVSSAVKSGAPSSQPESIDTNTGHGSDHRVIKSKSDNMSEMKPVVELKKSLSEMRIESDEDEDEDVNYRRPATARAARNADHDEFDAKADDFISRFKQQLKLQRLESLVRFRDMLNRGT